MRTRQGFAVCVMVVSAVLGVTACAPAPATTSPSIPNLSAPSESPTIAPAGRPDVSELVLTTAGLGELTLGSPPPANDPDLDFVSYYPDACAEEGLPGLWLSNFPLTDIVVEPYGALAPFAIGVWDDGSITRIDVNTPEISTEAGIHLGSTLEELLAAYPESAYEFDDLVSLYVEDGASGRLVFEVAAEQGSDGYWGDEVGTVIKMRAIVLDAVPTPVTFTDSYVGICSFA